MFLRSCLTTEYERSKKMPYFKLFNLQLFGEEGVAADSGVATTDSAGITADSNISSDGQVAPDGNISDIPSWDDLIKGQYKKEYSQAVKAAVDKRFKNQQNLQSKIDAIDPMVRALAERYGVSANPDGSIPIDALTGKVIDDNSMYEQEAFQRGMSVDDLKQMKALERENQMLRMNNQRTAEQQEWDSIVEQAELCKTKYPEFDLDAEMSNAQFGRLLATMQKSGFPNAVETAYEAVHRDEIMSGAMRYAVAQTEQKISNSIQSGMRRPSENGTSASSSATINKFDPSHLTREQLNDIRRRAESGERITF